MERIINKSKYYLWLILMGCIIHSCTKTKYNDYEEVLLNQIQEYRVTNAQQELLGAIDNDRNTITVYIPYYVGLEYLNAEIKLDEGARLLNSEGLEIDFRDGGLDPVAVGADSVKYTVVPAVGEQRIYTLIQKVLPHGDSLKVSYQQLAEGQTTLIKSVNSPLTITGNFNSSSSAAKFFLTDKATGDVYTDFIRNISMVPGADGYTLNTYISPYALKGNYAVRMEHQGRSTELPDLKLFYADDPWATIRLTSSVHWAAGDTMKFGISLGSSIPTIFLHADRMYIKIRPNDAFTRTNQSVFTVPAGFSETMYNQEVEMKIVSQDRDHIWAIFPDIPNGRYENNLTIYQSPVTYREDGSIRIQVLDSNIGFYVDFADETGWEKGRIISVPSPIAFTVLEKP